MCSIMEISNSQALVRAEVFSQWGPLKYLFLGKKFSFLRGRFVLIMGEELCPRPEIYSCENCVPPDIMSLYFF